MTSSAIKNLQILKTDYDTKFKAFCKLNWKYMCRLGVYKDAKLKRIPAHELNGSKLDLQYKTAKAEYIQARQAYLDAKAEEQLKWSPGYWVWFHSWNRKEINDRAKDIVSDMRSLLNNHRNMNLLMKYMDGDVNSRINLYYTVRHFRHKGFECDCDYCALNVHFGNKLYKKFYRGTPKNNPNHFLAIKGE